MRELSLSGQFAPVRPAFSGSVTFGVLGSALAVVFVAFHWSFALVGGLTILVLSFVGSEKFLLAVIFLVPVGWFTSSDVPIHDLATVIRLLVVGGFFLGRFWREELSVARLMRPLISRLSLLFLGVAVVSVSLAKFGWTHDSGQAVLRLFSYVLFYFMIVDWADSRQRIRRIFLTLLASGIVVASFALLQILIGGYTPLWIYLNPLSGHHFSPWGGRATSFLNYPNSLAGYLNLLLPLALACYLCDETRRWRRLALATLVTGVAALVSTQSLGGVVAFGCVLALAVVFFVGGRIRRLVWLGILSAFGVLLFLAKSFLSPSHTHEAMIRDVATRGLLWATAFHLFSSSPTLGVGYGNFVGVYGSYLQFDWMPAGVYDTHNLYLQLLAEVGVLGFVAFFGLIFVTLRHARRLWVMASDRLDRVLAFGVIGAVLALLVHGLVDFLFEVSTPFGTLFWIMLALLTVQLRACYEGGAKCV